VASACVAAQPGYHRAYIPNEIRLVAFAHSTHVDRRFNGLLSQKNKQPSRPVLNRFNQAARRNLGYWRARCASDHSRHIYSIPRRKLCRDQDLSIFVWTAELDGGGFHFQ
jgi:hypothetical protein